VKETTMDKQMRKMISETVSGDKVTITRDGSLKVRHSYFYRFGMTPESIGKHALKQLNDAGYTADLSTDYGETFDHWAPWPKDSYMQATLKNVRAIEA
jgi:hypothetical protein